MRSHFDTYRWHSINIVPSAVIYPAAYEGDPLAPNATGIELTILGRILRVVVPLQLVKSGYTLGCWGPAWSRRRRCWYTIGEEK